MVVDDELAEFVESAVMIIVGSVDAQGVPGIARGVGARVDRAADRLDLLVSAWQWPEAIAGISATGRLAATFTRPADYVSLQLKGAVEAVRPATTDEEARAAAYIAAVRAALVSLGLDSALARPWLTARALTTLRLRPEAAFIQTPGAQAGQPRP